MAISIRTRSKCFFIAVLLAASAPALQSSAYAQSDSSSSLVTVTFRSAIPEPVEVRLDSQPIGVTPIHFMAHPARRYVFSYQRKGYYSLVDTLVLHAASDTTVEIHLAKEPAIRITSNPSHAEIDIGGNVVGRTPLVVSDLRPEALTITLRKDSYESWQASLVPKVNDTISVNAILKSCGTLVSVFATPSEATILLDDKIVSTGSLSDYALAAGPHRISVRDDRTGHEASILTTPSADERSVFRARLGVNSIERGLLASVVPGSAQLMDQEYLKGTAMLVGCAGLGYFALRSRADYLDRQTAYDNAWTRYINAPTEDEAYRRHGEMEAKKTELDRAYTRSTIALGVFAACYIYSLADALLGHLATDEIELVPAADMTLVPPGLSASAIPLGAQINVKF